MAAIGTEAGASGGIEDAGDESIPLCFTRLALAWKPRFFGR